MQVRVGSSLSDVYDQEQGVPQGGVLSTTLLVHHFTPNIPAWCLKQPEILFDLHSGKI